MDGCAKSEPFALQVLGDSMEPEFPDGCIIVVEPDGLIEDGCYVVARANGEYIFRQLRIDESGWRLTALQPGHPELEIGGLEDIRGRVIQRAGTRRRDHKSYI